MELAAFSHTLDDSIPPKFFYLVERLPAVNQREALLDWLTCRDRLALEVDAKLLQSPIITLTGTPDELSNFTSKYAINLKPSQHPDQTQLFPSPVTDKLPVYGILPLPDSVENHDSTLLLIRISDTSDMPAFSMGDRLYLQADMIPNYKGDSPLLTDVGKLLMNQLLLVYPFGDLVPYLNERFDPGKLDDMVAKMILDKKITRAMYNTYMENGYWYCEDGSLSTATWSEKSLTTDPKVLQRKQELLAQYKDQLNDPLVLAKIEKELIDMDKEWLKGDTAAPFYAVEGGKAWKEQRKKMFITVGMAIGFDKGANSFTFIPNSLEDGWTPETLPQAANDIRRGSYGRGIETAKGGEQTKFVLRIFQDVTIDEDDCGTKRGITVTLTENNYKEYLGRYLADDGTVLTTETAKPLIGKTVVIRSPMYCKTNPGYCYKCCGDLFKNLDVRAIGMQAISVTSGFTSLSMKSMHTSSVSSTNVKRFSRFLRG